MPGTLRLMLKRFYCRADYRNHGAVVTPWCLSAFDWMPNQSVQLINVSVIKEEGGRAVTADVLFGLSNCNPAASPLSGRCADEGGSQVQRWVSKFAESLKHL